MEIVSRVSLASIQLQGLDIFASWRIPWYALFYGFHKILNAEKKQESTSCGKLSVLQNLVLVYRFSPLQITLRENS